MPDSSGRLTTEEHQKFVAWLQAKWGTNRTCEMCGASNWNVGNILAAPPPLSNGNTFLFGEGGNHQPVLAVICTNCANTKYVNAIIAGIIVPFRKS